MNTIKLHQFRMGDVEDIDIYIAQPIHEWQQTEKGQWCMLNASDMTYWTTPDPYNYGYQISITGKLEQPQAVEFILRWGHLD